MPAAAVAAAAASHRAVCGRSTSAKIVEAAATSMPPVSSSWTPTSAETDRLEAITAVLETAEEASFKLHSALPSYVVTAVQVVDRTSFYLCLPLSCHDLSSVCLVASRPLRPFVN